MLQRLQVKELAEWDPEPLLCYWCRKWRYVDASLHHIEDTWRTDADGHGAFECHKLCWLVPRGDGGSSVGLLCRTPEQECVPPCPREPHDEGVEQSLALTREWFVGEGDLESNAGNIAFEEVLRARYFRYLAYTGEIVPEGICGQTTFGDYED